MRPKTKTLFTLSVLLNLLLIGITTGMVMRKWDHRSWHHYAEKDFSPAVRDEVSGSIEKFKSDMKSTFADSRRARREIVEILQAPEFDEAAFDQASARMNQAYQGMIARKTDIMKDLAQRLPPEERVKLGGKFMRPYGPHRKGYCDAPGENEKAD